VSEWTKYIKLWLHRSHKWWALRSRWSAHLWWNYWKNTAIKEIRKESSKWTIAKWRSEWMTVISTSYSMSIKICWETIVSETSFNNWLKSTSKWSSKRWRSFTLSWGKWFRK